MNLLPYHPCSRNLGWNGQHGQGLLLTGVDILAENQAPDATVSLLLTKGLSRLAQTTVTGGTSPPESTSTKQLSEAFIPAVLGCPHPACLLRASINLLFLNIQDGC